eukprot:926570-Prymnesium_polylepis.1
MPGLPQRPLAAVPHPTTTPRRAFLVHAHAPSPPAAGLPAASMPGLGTSSLQPACACDRAAQQ